MYPELTAFGAPGVHTYSVMMALAVVVGTGFGVHRTGVRGGLGAWRTLAALGAITLLVFAGGRAHYVVNRWQLGIFQERPLEMLKAWQGLHAPGALLALVAGTPIVLRVLRLPIGRFVDGFAPAVFLGIALARLGCFLNGCCFGKRCEAFFCLAFPPGSPAHRMHLRSGAVAPEAWSAAVHPFQLYLVGVCIVAALVAVTVERRRRYDGQAGLVGIAVYLAGAALLEPFRDDILPRGFGWGGLTQLQVLGLGLAALAGALALAGERLGRRSPARARRDGEARASVNERRIENRAPVPQSYPEKAP